MPNFTALDMSLPEVATLVAAMVQARDAVPRMVRTARCPTYSTIWPHQVAAGSALIGIGAGCTTSSRSRARCSSFDGTPGGATTGTTLGQFRLDDAPALLEGFHLFFRRGDDLLRERCEQRLKSLVSIDRKHPVVLPVAPPGRRRVKTACARLARYDHFAA